ncbi:MAG TPA: trehalase family glycosidase [Opitutaceae bacterium]|nr:trehalase family glycosidase [Opitutaceae bacterium]
MNALAIAAADARHRVLARGWNTWDTRSVLRHVLLPEGLCVSLGLAAFDKLVWLNEAHFGRQRLGRTAGTKLTSTDRPLPIADTIEVRPGLHAYDGGYTELEVNLRGARFRVETAARGEEWVARVTPLQDEPWPRFLTVHAGFAWNRPGQVSRRDEHRLTAQLGEGRSLTIFSDGDAVDEPNLPLQSPYLALRLERPVSVCAGCHLDGPGVARRIAEARAVVVRSHAAYGPQAEGHEAMQSSLAWNLIYEPKFRRVLCTVARDWNCVRGGYAVFCWDTFLTSWMIAQDEPNLGWACLLEAFREMVGDAFVANVVQGTGRRALDRSQPPVGGVCVLGMHRNRPDPAALAAAWPALLAWNRWWHRARRNVRGSLSLGSDPFVPRVGDPAEFVQPNTAAGAALEALDNSPMYDHAPFDPVTHLMQIEDVGLNSLYVADCEALAEVATVLGHAGEAAELRARAAEYAGKVRSLWAADSGLFLNRRLDHGTWSPRHSPTSFYPLFAGVATPAQAARLVTEHLLNPEEYAGEWMIPAAPRNDPAFSEQLYMRGRIWPPLNFLVYLGLRRYGFAEVRRTLAEKSSALLVRNWREHRVAPENFSAFDGTGGIAAHSHPLLTWSGLLAFIGMIEEGRVGSPLAAVGEPVDPVS